MSTETLDPRGQNMRDLSARTLDEVRKVPTERIRKGLEAFEREIGGREALSSLLVQGTFTSDEEKFVAILGDTEADSIPLANLLGTFGLSPARFFKLLGEASAVKAVYASMDRVYRRLPDVAEHTMERAIPREQACKACDGRGTYPVIDEGEKPEVCLACKGAGVFRTEAATEDVKLALQVGGLLKGGNSVTVTNQVDARTLNVNGGTSAPSGSPAPAYVDFLKASDRILFGRAALPEAKVEPVAEVPLDAEIVEEIKP